MLSAESPKPKAEEFFKKLPDLSENQLLDLLNQWQDYKASEVLDFLDYIYKQAPAIDLGLEVFDCCGTGGDAANTFNISTCAAILAAGIGTKVCKNGGRSTTSKTGSVDVLEALGLNLSVPLETKIAALKKHHLAFYSSQVSAELLAPLKQISRIAKLTSILSLIGPLASPVKLQAQVIGIGKEKWIGTMVDAAHELIQRKSREKIILVHSQVLNSEQRLDELSTASQSKIIEISAAGLSEFEFHPQDLDLETAKLADLETTSTEDSAEKITEIINYSGSGESFQARLSSAALNAALITSLKTPDEFLDKMQDAYQKTKQALENKQVSTNWQEFKNS